MDKVAYVRSQSQIRSHGCHWPGCKAQVPPAKWGCYRHWMRLPRFLRERIWKEYRPGQEITMDPSPAYMALMEEVQAWIKEHLKGLGV